MATNYSDSSSDIELVDIVDQKGRVIGKATRDQVYKDGLLHPAVNIVVINKNGQIFIQRRSLRKILPLYWDISASEHLKFGESFESAATRGLREELSIETPVKLLFGKHIQNNEYKSQNITLIEYELVEFYGALYDGKIEINQEEVTEGRFISFRELHSLIKNPLTKFTPWGLEEVNCLLNNPTIVTELIG